MPKLAEVLPAILVGRLKEPGDHPVGGVAGLMLRITPSGSRSWVLRVRVAGRRPEYGLGSFPAVKLADAREAAAAALKGLKAGVDPAAAKAQARAKLAKADADRETFAEAAAKYIEANRAGWRNAKHADQWESTLKAYAEPVIGALPTAEVTVALVLKILRPIWSEKAETASRVRQRIERVIAAADAEAGRERLNPARIAAINAVLPPRAKAATVVAMPSLPYAEMPEFMKRLSAAPGIGPKALEWTILTAARSGMTRAMTWSELDLAAMTWTVPGNKMKMGRAWTTTLTPEMVALLPSPGKPGDFVFPGRGKGRPLSDMTLTRSLQRMGLAVVPHGFRATFKTWATEATDHHSMAVELQLAHVGGDAIEQAYQRGELQTKRAALLRDWVAFLASAKPAADAAKPAAGGLRLVS